jgi:hypothetical protein
MREDFRPILGYDGHYEINSSGDIKSFHRGKEIIRKPGIVKGYKQIDLWKDGNCKRKMVHRLVWETFKGTIPETMEICHGIGNDRLNCNLEYLSLGTKSDNNGRDKRRDGKSNNGEKNGNVKLSVDQVHYIRQRLQDNMSADKLAGLFKVHRTTIFRIQRRANWSHVA